jgi:hypothetical protein
MKPALLLAAIILIGGCTGWRDVANRSLNGAKELARESEAFEVKKCGADPVVIANQCKTAGDKVCKKYYDCRVLTKAVLTLWVAIRAAQGALINTAKTKQATQALVLAALEAYGPVQKAIERWAQ